MKAKHGWTVDNSAPLTQELLREFILDPISAVPSSVAKRVGRCRITVAARLDDDSASGWTVRPGGVHIEVAAEDIEPHDLAMELLICLGQVIWYLEAGEEHAGYLRLIGDEMHGGVGGEIDDEVLVLKQELLESAEAARSPEKIESYAAASFAATFGEYVHALWHDVSVRTGPEHLEPGALKKRLEYLRDKWPPDEGQQLFA